MDDRVKKLDTVKKCNIFAKNCLEHGRDDLAQQAKARSLQILANDYGSDSQPEREALEAVFAYEEVLSIRNGKKTRANRTWQSIKSKGIIKAVEAAVERSQETQGFIVLKDMGLEEYAFEHVVLRYPHLFSDKAVAISESRVG